MEDDWLLEQLLNGYAHYTASVLKWDAGRTTVNGRLAVNPEVDGVSALQCLGGESICAPASLLIWHDCSWTPSCQPRS